MKNQSRALSSLVLLVFLLGAVIPIFAADFWESLGLRKRAQAALAVTEEQATAGIKEALAKGVERAVTNLGRTDGFLSDAQVRIPLPSKLQWIEKALRTAGQEGLANEFITTMNRAAEEAVPSAASVLGDAIRKMTLADAQSIVRSTNAAATDYFRRTSEADLHSRFLPIVKSATERTGVTATYKRMLDKAGLQSLGSFGQFGRSLIGADNLDLDDYVTDKALDGLFTKISDEEMRIRQNPGARTTEILEKVFGSRK